MARRDRGGYSQEELAQLRAGIVRNGDMRSISKDVRDRVNAERDARIRKEQANSALNQARADSGRQGTSSLGAHSELISRLERIRNSRKTREKPLRRPADLEDRRTPLPGKRPTYSGRHPDFNPPTGVSTQALVTWYNPETGETFEAPNGGYTPKEGTGWTRKPVSSFRGDGSKTPESPIGRPVPPRYTRPGGTVNIQEALKEITTQQDKPTVTREKSKAFGDLLKRMKRF